MEENEGKSQLSVSAGVVRAVLAQAQVVPVAVLAALVNIQSHYYLYCYSQIWGSMELIHCETKKHKGSDFPFPCNILGMVLMHSHSGAVFN